MSAFDLFNNHLTENKKGKIDLDLLYQVIDRYNKTIFKYTQQNLGNISKPVNDLSLIPNQYNTINDYLNSKSSWKQIIKFIKECNIEDISDYIDIMIKNWNNIKQRLHISNINRPSYKIIFSLKMLNMYYEFRTKENNALSINSKIVTDTIDGFYDLNPNFENSNWLSLKRLKSLNSDLNYAQIVTIFNGEFSSDFVDKIKRMSYNDIELELKSR